MPEEINRYNDLADFYIAVELELDNVNHCGVPLGSLLSRYFTHSFRKNAFNFQVESTLKIIYQIVRYFLLSFFPDKENRKVYKLAAEKKPKYIIAKIDNKQERGNRLFRDLLYKCSPHIFYTTKNNNIDRNISIPIIQYRWGYISFWQIFTIIPKCFRSTNVIHRKLKTRSDIIVPYLEAFLNVFYTTLQLNAWKRFFKKYKPQVVLTDYDRINPEVIMAAKRYGIATVTLVHGIIDKRYGYYPVLADNVFCWGEEQKDYFLAKGIEEKRIKITGNPIAESIAKLSLEEVLSKYKIDSSQDYKFIGLALSMINAEQNSILIKGALDALGEKGFLIVKLHPSDKQQALFTEKFKEYKNVFFSGSISFQEFISVIECCIMQNSGIGNELIVCNVPVLFFNNDGSMVYSSYYPFFKDYFYCSSGEIKDELDMLLNSAEYYQNMQKRQRSILKENIFYKVSQDAADENIMQLGKIA
ncbi:MAG TPA: UDP-N-acetylglucosamine 2-epimerase [Flavipsychrobacter sp.]|nr:UDP-N-acetylglucosamine 2-epimerase [Flavipsychrobacter sp.]